MSILKPTFQPKQCLFLMFVLIVYISSSYCGCIRSRCSGLKGLRGELGKTINILRISSPLLAASAYRAVNYTDYEYGITDAACNPNCDSPVTLVIQDMNLTRSSWMNVSRSDILEFYRRVSFSFSDQLANSMAELSRAKKETVLPAYLSSLQDMVDIIKKLLSRAVAVDRKLSGLPPLSTAVAQQSVMRNSTTLRTIPTRSIAAVACHFSRCVLYTILQESYRMIQDFVKRWNNL